MKQAACILAGALAGSMVGYMLIVLLTRVHEMYFATGQDDMSRFAGALMIVIFPLSLVLGTWVGSLAYLRIVGTFRP